MEVTEEFEAVGTECREIILVSETEASLSDVVDVARVQQLFA